MIVCPNCRTKNRDTARFCNGCSAPLVTELICANCGTTNSSIARFCNFCASPLQGVSASFGLTGMLAPSTILEERYLIVRKLGEGGMGAVYLVTDSRLGNRKCALKEMSDAAITDPKELQQAKKAFQREAEMLSKLSHPALPRVTDFFSEGNKHYLVMDYAEGQPMDELLEQRTQPFPETRVVAWAGQICDVLAYLHSQTPPIIYRDLKPGNIMVASGKKKVKLIDFGIARTFKQQRSKDTVAMGTPGYSPPEQYGKGQTDHRSDIYALGATLHHLLTLRDPGDEPFLFPRVATLNPRVSSTVDRTIMKAIEQDRAKRWQSAKEMGQALVAKPWPTVPKPSPVSVPKSPAAAAPTVARAAKPRVATPSSYTAPTKTTATLSGWYQTGRLTKQFLDKIGLGDAISPGLERSSFWGYVMTIVLMAALQVGVSTAGPVFWEFDEIGRILYMALLNILPLLAAIITKRPAAFFLTVLGRAYPFAGIGVYLLQLLAADIVLLLGKYQKFTFWWLFFALAASTFIKVGIMGVWEFEYVLIYLVADLLAVIGARLIGRWLKKV